MGTVFTCRKKEGFDSAGLRCVFFVPDFYYTKDFVLLVQSYNSLEGNRKLLNRRKENGIGTGRQSPIQVKYKGSTVKACSITLTKFYIIYI